MILRSCDACDEQMVWLVGVNDDNDDPLIVLGTCRAHLVAAVERCEVLVITSDFDDLYVTLDRSALAPEPATEGPFDRAELTMVR